MKILCIAPQPFFSPRGTPFSVYYRCLVMSELGVEIDLLTYGQGQDVNIPGMRTYRIPRFAVLGDVKTGPSILKLFLDVFMVIWTVVLLLRKRYAFVHAHEESVFFCSFLKPLFRFKLVYDMHSSLPQQLENFQYHRSPLLLNLFRLLEDIALQRADAVITICPDLAAYARKRMREKERHLLIENSLFEPVRLRSGQTPDSGGNAEVAPKPDPLDNGRKWVVYTGTLEAYQGIEILIEAYMIVAKKRADVDLLLVGGTPDQVAFFKKMARDSGIAERVVFTGRVSQAEAQKYARMASVLVSPRSRGTNTPLKIYEQLASDIPLVATNIYSHTQVLTPEVAFLVDPTTEGMADGILSALAPDGDGRTKAAKARQLYQTAYSRDVYKDRIRRLLGILSEDSKINQKASHQSRAKDRIKTATQKSDLLGRFQRWVRSSIGHSGGS